MKTLRFKWWRVGSLISSSSKHVHVEFSYTVFPLLKKSKRKHIFTGRYQVWVYFFFNHKPQSPLERTVLTAVTEDAGDLICTCFDWTFDILISAFHLRPSGRLSSVETVAGLALSLGLQCSFTCCGTSSPPHGRLSHQPSFLSHPTDDNQTISHC